ncbi:M48 family metallopeptidase [Actinopolyspora saharensis]|uniref:Uncharacterized protein n=1 Tax=Actinopolyspora saharensis TaxID=995062 RepID=A0A1H1EYB5_9ACTN|nr:M48 family metallopeptidase [Actinopolyspora saharensis]SDQ93735.1 hypothetical protein SAMN04489718_2745 [Actinopolyspora saharensis]
MRGPWRAALTSALHIGFFAVPAVLVLGLFGIAAYAARYDFGNGARAALAGLVVAVCVLVMLRGLLGVDDRPRGVLVSGDAQPQLWRTVRKVAKTAEAPEPDELRITCDTGVRLRERTRLLGLLRGTRCLEIGLPLLAGLTVTELSVVLTQELSKGGGSFPETLACRVRDTVLDTERKLTAGPTKWLFSGHARLCAALTTPLVRTRILRGDAIATRLAGKRTTMATLRKHVGLQLGWRDYTKEYLSMAARMEHTPDVLLGFRSFLDNQHRKKDLAERAKETIAAERADDPSRPTASQRLEALKRASASEPDETDDRPAVALVRNPRKSIPSIEDRLLVDGLGTRVPWPELARMAADHDVAVQAGRLSSAVVQSGVEAEPNLAGVLAAMHRGEMNELINPALNPGLSPELVDEAVVDTTTELLGATVVDALVQAGHAKHELDWSGPPKLQLADGRALDPDKLVRPAVADPRLVPGLHRHLLHLGVALDHERPPSEEPSPKLSGLVSPVLVAKSPHDLFVTDRGVLLLPNRTGTLRRLLAGAFARLRRTEHERLERLAETPVAELRELEGSQWVDSRDVATAELHRDVKSWELTMELYLDDYAVSELSESLTEPAAEDSAGEEELARLRISSVTDSFERGTPYSGVGDLLGARLSTDQPSHSDE